MSAALWIPFLWLFITASRFLSQWLTLLNLMGRSGGSLEDGSPIDAAYFLFLILLGIVVLARRNVSLVTFARNNGWLTAFMIYCFLAILWSDFPFVAFKRWIKTLGHPIMILIVLTEPNPREAIKRVLKRVAFLILPLSVLFIKYYPQYGRGFDSYTGEAFNNGVGLNKNELGYGCLVFGLFFFWNLLSARKLTPRLRRWEEYAFCLVFLGMIGWLSNMANSATALSCFVVGAATMVVVSTPLVSKRFIGTYILVAVALAVGIEATFHVYSRVVVDVLGRNATLTDRTAVWADLFAIKINPIIGAGFESFWLGDRLDILWAKWWWHPNQAHNGYIETYLNLGWLGLMLLGCLFVATFRKARLELLRDLDYGRFRLGLLFAILVYNYTEATFKGVHLVWTMFYLIALDYPYIAASAAKELDATAVPKATAVAPMPARWAPAAASTRQDAVRSAVGKAAQSQGRPSWAASRPPAWSPKNKR